MMTEQNFKKQRNSIATMQSTNGVNSLQSNQGFKSRKKMYVCRICLEEYQNIDLSKEAFVKPCRCSGSLQFVHQTCLLEWLNTMIKNKIEAGEPLQAIHCEICQDLLEIEYSKKLVCRNISSIKNKIQIFRTYFLLCLGFILFSLCGMALIAYFQIKSKGKTAVQQNNLKVIFSIAWALLCLSLIMWVVKLLKVFFIKRQTFVAKIQSKSLVIQIKTKPSYESQNPQNKLPLSQHDPQSLRSSRKYPSPMENSETQTAIVRRKIKFVPIKPAIQNHSGVYLNEHSVPENQQAHI